MNTAPAPTIEPDQELNNKVLESIRQKDTKETKGKRAVRLSRVAVAMIAVFCLAPLGVYAANQVWIRHPLQIIQFLLVIRIT